MTSAESRRHDLYNGLTQILGNDRADTSTAYLPFRESTELATRSDLDDLEERLAGRIDLLDHRFDLVDQQFEALTERLHRMTQRLDRIILALVAGLVAIIATLVVQSFL